MSEITFESVRTNINMQFNATKEKLQYMLFLKGESIWMLPDGMMKQSIGDD